MKILLLAIGGIVLAYLIIRGVDAAFCKPKKEEEDE